MSHEPLQLSRGALMARGGIAGYNYQKQLLQQMQQAPPEKSIANQVFNQFCTANTFQEVMGHFQTLCDVLEVKPSEPGNFYQQIKSHLTSWKAQNLWTKLDKRASHKEYQKGSSCKNTRVLIIGGGPCGLRTAIEVALLGGKAVVLEKRDRFSRNSVLHLWPFLIHDLKALGAKKFFGKFCAGSIDHISIRSLQCILLKVCLLLGVEVHPGVSFESLKEPHTGQSGEEVGWRANVSPSDHPVSEFEFDVLIGADGKRNTLEGFKRKEFRGKLAIAITANFINSNTNAEARVEEISGVAFIFNQKFFKDLNAKTGIDLENIVYYKDETHYFIMTAKKHSLLRKGVLKKDCTDTAQLLSKDNVDQEALMAYACEAADVSTRTMLPKLEFAHNHYGQPDVAMFDFTSLYAAEHASQVKEVCGRKLLLALVGDSLLEPFWPTGSGCARGFLGALDAAWMIKSWASGKMTPLEVMAERESVYQLLSQTTPENLQKNASLYTIDPNSRYPNINTQFFKPHQVRHQYYGGDHKYLDEIVQISEQKSKKYEWVRDSHYLFKWFQRQLEPYKNSVRIMDLTTSWRNGIALCSLIHKYRPELIDISVLDASNIVENNQMAFDIAEKEFGITPVMNGQDLAMCDIPDKLTMVSYLSQFYEYFRKESVGPVKVDSQTEKSQSQTPHSASSRLSILSRISNRIRQRREREEHPNDDSDAVNKSSVHPTFSHGMMSKRLRVNYDQSDVVLQGYSKLEEQQDPALPPARVRHKSKPSPGVRGANKVSALAKDLAHKFKGQDTPPLTKKQNPKALIMGQAPSAEVCYFCAKRVYLVERHSAEGVFFHRGCLKCEYCKSNLRIGQYAFLRGDNGEAQFYCIQHLGLSRPIRRDRKRSYAEDFDEVDLPEFEVQPIETEKSPDHPDVKPSIKRTPERIEYYTESEVEESEWEQTKHNLSATLLNIENDSQSDSSTEEEVDWSDEELSDGETSWADLAKAYNTRLGRSVSKKHQQRKHKHGSEEDIETETAIEESDDDWETESETEKESEGEDSDDEPLRPRKVYQISDTVQTTKAAMPMFTQVSPPPAEEREPSEVVQTARANRMSFFSAAPEPVRIDAFSFLGIDKHPQRIFTKNEQEPSMMDECPENTNIVKQEEDEFDSEIVINSQTSDKEEYDYLHESSSNTESSDEDTMTEGSESEEMQVNIIPHLIPTIQVEEVYLNESESCQPENEKSLATGSAGVDECYIVKNSQTAKNESSSDIVESVKETLNDKRECFIGATETSVSEALEELDTKDSEDYINTSEQTVDEQESIITEIGLELSESVGVGEKLSTDEEQLDFTIEIADTEVQKLESPVSSDKGKGITCVEEAVNDSVSIESEPKLEGLQNKNDLESSMNDSFHEVFAEDAPLANMGEFDSEFMATTTADSAGETEPDDMPTPPNFEVLHSVKLEDSKSPSTKEETDAIKRIDDLLEKLKHSSDEQIPTSTLDRDSVTASFVADLPVASRISDSSVKGVTSESTKGSLVEVTVSADNSEEERSFVVDESFVTSRDKRKRSQHPNDHSDSILTISTPSGSSTSSITEIDSTQLILDHSCRDTSMSLDHLVQNALVDDPTLSLENLVNANISEENDIASPIKPAEIVKQLKEELSSMLTTGNTSEPLEEILSSLKSTPAGNSTKNGSIFLSAESSATEITEESMYFTPDVSGIECRNNNSVNNEDSNIPSLILTGEDLNNSLKSSNQTSPLVSPSHVIVDAKRRFFFETAQPVRIDPKKVFDDFHNEDEQKPLCKIPGGGFSLSSQIKPKFDASAKSVINGLLEAEKNIKNQQKNDIPDVKSAWKSLDSGITSDKKKLDSVNLNLKRDWQSLDSGTPTLSSPTAGVPHADSVNGESDVFYTPATSKKLNEKDPKKQNVDPVKKTLTEKELKTSRKAEREKARTAARERARMMSDEELGIEDTKMNQKTNAIKKVLSEECGLRNNKPKDLVERVGMESDYKPDITSLKSDPSPSLLHKDVYSISSEESKSESCKSDKTKDKKFKFITKSAEKEKKPKETAEKKDKRRSFLSMLLPSKSLEKKEKENQCKSPKLHHEKEHHTESDPESKTPKAEHIKDKKEKTPTEKKIPKLRAKLKSKSLEKEVKEKHTSAYDEFSSMFDDMFGSEDAAPKKKEQIYDRLQAVAPARTPPRPRFPPKATVEDFDTESEYGDDKSVRSFHSQLMSEEDRARLLRKQEKAAARRQREMELKRLRKAQEIQRQLEEVEQRQRDVETRGIQIERSLRGEGQDASRTESEMMQEWFNVVHEKNLLVRYESELMVHARELELEDRHARLEAQLRKLFVQPDTCNETEQKEEEKRILEELLEVVEQRDALVALLEEDRLKEQEEDQNLRDLMVTRGFQLSPVTYMQQMRQNVTNTPSDSDLDSCR